MSKEIHGHFLQHFTVAVSCMRGIYLKIAYYILVSFLLFMQTGSRNCVLTKQEARYVNELAPDAFTQDGLPGHQSLTQSKGKTGRRKGKVNKPHCMWKKVIHSQGLKWMPEGIQRWEEKPPKDNS